MTSKRGNVGQHSEGEQLGSFLLQLLSDVATKEGDLSRRYSQGCHTIPALVSDKAMLPTDSLRQQYRQQHPRPFSDEDQNATEIVLPLSSATSRRPARRRQGKDVRRPRKSHSAKSKSSALSPAQVTASIQVSCSEDEIPSLLSCRENKRELRWSSLENMGSVLEESNTKVCQLQTLPAGNSAASPSKKQDKNNLIRWSTSCLPDIPVRRNSFEKLLPSLRSFPCEQLLSLTGDFEATVMSRSSAALNSMRLPPCKPVRRGSDDELLFMLDESDVSAELLAMAVEEICES